MIDVFIRFAPKSPLRMYLASAVLCRWLEELDVNLHCMFMKGTYAPQIFPGLCEVELGIADFCWTTRNYADSRAEGEFYILADDDHLILGENWAKRGIEGMKPGYGLMSARSVIAGERMDYSNWTGCPAVIRKGKIDYRMLEGTPNHQDEIVCDTMREHGLMTGFMDGLDYNHLGFGFSQVTPELWNRY